jgi:predicted Zn finger-like uncharacterized protein
MTPSTKWSKGEDRRLTWNECCRECGSLFLISDRTLAGSVRVIKCPACGTRKTEPISKRRLLARVVSVVG